MANVTTIDERLRSTARKELTVKINRATNEFCKAIGIDGSTDRVSIPLIEAPDNLCYNRDVISAIREAAIEKLAPKYEEQAVSAFLKKVDSLSDQVEELYNQAGQ